MEHLTALRVFRNVVQLGSFAQAARQLRLSPAAVSKNIGELEAHLGARLLTVLPHVLCGAPAYLRRHGVPDTPQALRGHNCLRFTLSGHAHEWNFHRHGQTVPVRYQVNSSLAVRDALRAGFGLSPVPRTYVEDDLAQGRLTGPGR